MGHRLGHGKEQRPATPTTNASLLHRQSDTQGTFSDPRFVAVWEKQSKHILLVKLFVVFILLPFGE